MVPNGTTVSWFTSRGHAVWLIIAKKRTEQRDRGDGGQGFLVAVEFRLQLVCSRQHQREQHEHGHGAAVDENLHQREELDRQQDVDAGNAEQRHDQQEGGVDNVPDKDHPQGAHDDDRSHDVEEYLCHALSPGSTFFALDCDSSWSRSITSCERS